MSFSFDFDGSEMICFLYKFALQNIYQRKLVVSCILNLFENERFLKEVQWDLLQLKEDDTPAHGAKSLKKWHQETCVKLSEG